jgi:hypothetical protein
MAKGYIIEEIRASVRLRDPESGKSIEVPLETGGHWTAPARGEQAPSERREPTKAGGQDRRCEDQRTPGQARRDPRGQGCRSDPRGQAGRGRPKARRGARKAAKAPQRQG